MNDILKELRNRVSETNKLIREILHNKELEETLKNNPDLHYILEKMYYEGGYSHSSIIKIMAGKSLNEIENFIPRSQFNEKYGYKLDRV